MAADGVPRPDTTLHINRFPRDRSSLDLPDTALLVPDTIRAGEGDDQGDAEPLLVLDTIRAGAGDGEGVAAPFLVLDTIRAGAAGGYRNATLRPRLVPRWRVLRRARCCPGPRPEHDPRWRRGRQWPTGLPPTSGGYRVVPKLLYISTGFGATDPPRSAGDSALLVLDTIRAGAAGGYCNATLRPRLVPRWRVLRRW